MQLNGIRQAVINAPGSTLSGLKSIGIMGGRGVSYLGSGLGNIGSYTFAALKDLSKSTYALCRNNVRQIGIAAAGLTVVAAIVYCSKRFFKPSAPAPAPAGDTVPVAASTRSHKKATAVPVKP